MSFQARSGLKYEAKDPNINTLQAPPASYYNATTASAQPGSGRNGGESGASRQKELSNAYHVYLLFLLTFALSTDVVGMVSKFEYSSFQWSSSL